MNKKRKHIFMNMTISIFFRPPPFLFSPLFICVCCVFSLNKLVLSCPLSSHIALSIQKFLPFSQIFIAYKRCVISIFYTIIIINNNDDDENEYRATVISITIFHRRFCFVGFTVVYLVSLFLSAVKKRKKKITNRTLGAWVMDRR